MKFLFDQPDANTVSLNISHLHQIQILSRILIGILMIRNQSLDQENRRVSSQPEGRNSSEALIIYCKRDLSLVATQIKSWFRSTPSGEGVEEWMGSPLRNEWMSVSIKLLGVNACEWRWTGWGCSVHLFPASLPPPTCQPRSPLSACSVKAASGRTGMVWSLGHWMPKPLGTSPLIFRGSLSSVSSNITHWTVDFQ